MNSGQRGYSNRDEVPIKHLEDGLHDVGYPLTQDRKMRLFEELDSSAYRNYKENPKKHNKITISLTRLKDALDREEKRGDKNRDIQGDRTQTRLARFEPKVRAHIERISAFLKNQKLSVGELHRRLDENNDGVLEKHEFVARMRDFRVP